MHINEFYLLLIDDDEDDFVFLRDLFQEITNSKYHIVWKDNYKEGLEAFFSQKFDLCLLDYRLGEHTGIDLLSEVQKLSPTCPIIVLTGHSDIDVDIQAMQLGAAEFLVKGQLTAPLLERTVRYSMKHALDMAELRESKAVILQQDRLASLGLLASSLAHEIGTPMGIIRSRAEMVQKKAETDSVKNDMGTIIVQIDRIAKLVSSLLNLAREKKSETATLVDLNSILQDVLNLLQHEFHRKDIELKVSMLEDVKVKAEAGPLSQVLLNLLVNSVHAIEVERQHGRKTNHKVVVSVEAFGSAFVISIQDTGCGIPEKNKAHIFKPFFTTKDIGQGTGLGLATSYNLIHSWGGSISVDNNQFGGATFKVKLHSQNR